MPKQRILNDVTKAKRASTNSTGGILQKHVGDRTMRRSAKRNVESVKSTRRRTVHFLLPGSQTPVSTRSDVQVEDTEMGESVQGCDSSSEKGQFSNGPRDVVNPIHQTIQSLSTVGIMDGAGEEESSFASSDNPGHDIEDNLSIESPGDDITRARETGSSIFQPLAGMGGEDAPLPPSFNDQESITEALEPANEHSENSPLVEASTDHGSQFSDATIELERLANGNLEDIAREAKLSNLVASPMLIDMDKGEPAVVSPSKGCDLDEKVKVSGDAVGRTSFFDMVLEDVQTRSQFEQHNADITLAGSSHELQPQLPYVDDAARVSLSKRPLEMPQAFIPAKRQRMDVALKSYLEQSDRNGESSNKATSQPQQNLTIAGHPPGSAAPPPVPTPTNWSSFTVANLRKELSKRRLPTRGVKAILVQRLTEFETTQAMQASLDKQNGHLVPVASYVESAAKGKGKGPEQTGPATVDVVAHLTNDTAAAAATNEVVDDVIAKDLIKSGDLLGGEIAEGDYPIPPPVFTAATTAEPCADVEMQDDTHEEVVLLTSSHLNSPVPKKIEQPEMDADTSLESVEAPAIESDMDKGTAPRCSGSGTMWIAKEAQRS